MGQYHKPVALDRREYLMPHELGDGLKLMEFGCSGMGTMTALAIALCPGSVDHSFAGLWAGERIAIVGDYAEPEDLPADDHAELIYNLCSSAEDLDSTIKWLRESERSVEADRLASMGAFYNLSEAAVGALQACGVVTGVARNKRWNSFEHGKPEVAGPALAVQNIDKRMYLSPERFGDDPRILGFGTDYAGGTMTALAVLLACSSNNGGRGGGDMHHDAEALVGSWAGDRLAIVPAELCDGFDLSEVIRKLLSDGGEGKYAGDAEIVKRERW